MIFLDDDDDEIDPDELRAFAAAFHKVGTQLAKESVSGQSHVEKYAKYRDDPVAFFKEVLGIEPWESADPEQSGQADILRAIAVHDKVATKSGQKTSKTCTAVGISLWWSATRSDAQVVMTAPSFEQIKGVLWLEMDRQNRPRVKGSLDPNGDPIPPPYRDSLEKVLGITIPLDPATGVKFPVSGNTIKGKSSNTAERMAGTSSPNLLYIIDEGSGYANEMYEAVLGNLTGGGKLFVISNPTRTSGWFFDLFMDRPVDWKLFTLNSENTPNVRAGRRVIPGVAERSTIQAWRANAGPDYANNPFYMVRVLGMFPPQGSNSVISMTLLERASTKWRENEEGQEMANLVFGVDIARQGDDTTVIYPVRGYYAYPPRIVPKALTQDGYMLAGEIAKLAAELRISNEDVRVNMDAGGPGVSPIDALRRHPACSEEGWLHVNAMVVGEKSDNEAAYVNLRTQLWFGAADWLKGGGRLQKHDRTIKELLSATYTFDARGRYKVEPKDTMKLTLGGKSPDFADALCLAVYSGNRGGFIPNSVALYERAPDLRHESAGGGDDDDWTRGEWG